MIKEVCKKISQFGNQSKRDSPLTRSQVYALVSVMVKITGHIPTFAEFTNHIEATKNPQNYSTTVKILSYFKRNYYENSCPRIQDYFNEITAVYPPSKSAVISSWFSGQRYDINAIQQNWNIRFMGTDLCKNIIDGTPRRGTGLSSFYKNNEPRFSYSTVKIFVAPYFNESHTYASNCAMILHYHIDEDPQRVQLKNIIDSLIVAMQYKYSAIIDKRPYDQDIIMRTSAAEKNDYSGAVKLVFKDLTNVLENPPLNLSSESAMGISYYLAYICLTGFEQRFLRYPAAVRELFSLLEINHYSSGDLKKCQKNLEDTINKTNKSNLTLIDLLRSVTKLTNREEQQQNQIRPQT